MTVKKDRGCERAGPRRRPRGARGLVRGAARSRPRAADLHRRDRCKHKNGAATRPLPPRRAALRQHPPPPLAHDHLGRRAQARRPRRADGALRRDERRGLPRLCPPCPGADAPARRYRCDGQPRRHKSAAVRTAIEAAVAELRLLPPYSPDFNPIEQAFSKLKALLRRAAARTRDTCGMLSPPPSTPSRQTVRQLLHRRRLRAGIGGKCSSQRTVRDDA